MADRPQSPTAELEERLLLDELGTLGREAGGAGGLLGGGLAGLFGGRRGGKRGAEAGGGRIRTDRRELEMRLDGDPVTVLSDTAALLQSEGRVLEDVPRLAEEVEEGVWAVVGAGAGGLNPVVVHVSAEPRGDRGCTLRIGAIAKEGLIKQRAAAKTAERIRAGLEGAGGPGA